MKKCYYCKIELTDYEIKLSQSNPGEKAFCLKCLDKSDDEILQIQKDYNN